MGEKMTLLPCPWCGEELQNPTVSEGSTFRWRKVDGCCTDGSEVRHDTMADDQEAAEVESRAAAIEAWNTRPGITQPAQAVDVPDRGPWRWMYDGSLRGTGAYTLQSDDFRHDAQIRVSGDFADHDDVAAYMKWLCAKLNGTAALPKDSNGAEGA